MSEQYGEPRPTSGWDRSGTLGHPCKFQWVSRLGSVTARHCSSGRAKLCGVEQKAPPIFSRAAITSGMAHISSFLNNCLKLTNYNDFWCVKSWENLTSIALCNLPTSLVYCSHFTLGNSKKSFFNSIIHTYFRLFTLSQKKTNWYSLITHHTWKMSPHYLVSQQI